MYSLIIIDDNPRDRRGIRELIESERLDIEIIHEFEDAEEALSRLSGTKPDIVLTDIDMPGMDGIQMTKCLKRQWPDLKVVFMSCHNEFDFVKSAIDLDSYGYLLKPIHRKDLRQTLMKVLTDYSAEQERQEEKRLLLAERAEHHARLKEMRPMLQEQLLRDILYGAAYQEQEIAENLSYLQFPVRPPFAVQLALFNMPGGRHNHEGRSLDDQYFHAFRIKNLIHAFDFPGVVLFPLQLSKSLLAVILFGQSHCGNEGTLLDCMIAMKEAVEAAAKSQIQAGVSIVSHTLSHLPDLFRQASEALSSGYYSDHSLVVLYEDIAGGETAPLGQPHQLAGIHAGLKQLLPQCGKEDLEQFVSRYLSLKARYSEHEVKSFLITVISLTQMVLLEYGVAADSLLDPRMLQYQGILHSPSLKEVRSWLADQLGHAASLIAQTRLDNGELSWRIKEIIKARYTEKLTSHDIAKLVNFSAVHSNFMFKRETGQTIFDYLTEFRMNKAKELLSEPNSKVYLVAEQVGYRNKSHFCLAFKKYTGMSPNEYKQLHQP